MRIYDENTMIGIKDIRDSIKNKGFIEGFRYHIRDTSGPNAYGYEFEIVYQKHEYNSDFDYWFWLDIKTIAKSKTTYFPNSKNKIGNLGAYGETFDIDEL